MTEGVWPKVNGDIFYASEANELYSRVRILGQSQNNAFTATSETTVNTISFSAGTLTQGDVIIAEIYAFYADVSACTVQAKIRLTGAANYDSTLMNIGTNVAAADGFITAKCVKNASNANGITILSSSSLENGVNQFQLDHPATTNVWGALTSISLRAIINTGTPSTNGFKLSWVVYVIKANLT